jgi:PAS domain S-box-containing protein
MSTPKTPASAQDARPIAFELDTTPHRASVLMVDDQPARLLTYEAMLSGLGVECVRALSGREALDKLLKQEFAVILLDVHMPEMDGFEVARLIREHPRMERMPIIFVTGVHVTEFDQLKGYEVGAIDYIAVPVVPEILRSKVAMLVELHQRRSELIALNAQLQGTRAQIEAEHAKVVADKDAQLRAAFEHPTDMTIVLRAKRDAQGNIADWIYLNANSSALRFLGRPREQVIDRTVREVLGDRADEAIELSTKVHASQTPLRYERNHTGQELLITIFPAGEDTLVSSGVDITDRKHAEAALRHSEARDQALLDSAPVGFAYNAMDGRFSYVNRAFYELVGYSAEELLHKTWQDITHPEDLAADLALGGKVLAGELSSYTMEKRYIRKDGMFVWARLFGNFVRDEAGSPIHGVAIVVDITERKLADQALRDSQQSVILAKEAAQLGIYDFDITTGALRWDERVYELFGLDPNQPVGPETFTDRQHPDDRASAKRKLDGALDPNGDGRYHASYRVISKTDGVVRWVDSVGRVLFDAGRPVRLVGAVQDVTRKKLAEQLLREREERFRELANNIDQFAWSCDRLGEATWYNDRWYEYTGTTFEEMQGKGWQGVIHPAHLDRIIDSLPKCIAGGRPWEDTYPIRGKDGSYRWFLTRAVPIRDANGAIVRWFGTNTDVTEQRKLQDALQEADRRKDEFLAMLAHELRNPVAPIRNAAEVLARLFADAPQPSSLIGMIQRQSAHLSRLLDDLLDVARITQGRIDLRREVLSVAACIDHALETVQSHIQANRHQLTLARPTEPLYVDADRVRLEQCITNLLTNAVKYTNPGGEICVRLFRENNEAGIEVADTGVGIAPEFLPRVFDLFAQSERALDRPEGGLGIGLSVCKQLIEMHGGSVSGVSEGIGRGATFTIRVPLHSSPLDAKQSEAAAVAATQRVLIVDDNRDAADSLAMCLILEGHDAKAVYAAAAALAEVEAFRPDVVLLDIGLPHIDGFEVARQIRATRPTIRVVALTGYGQEEDKQRTAAAGFEAHLTKPVDLYSLTTVLRAPNSPK